MQCRDITALVQVNYEPIVEAFKIASTSMIAFMMCCSIDIAELEICHASPSFEILAALLGRKTIILAYDGN